ncbi:MAG: rhamnan synthesis F family protein [Methanobrevibacter sp.]|uniref:rhamnan synthesis F family protein n=1 Tax=Methanobrevibacter sp. TaxID=66852 RepID=UPI002E786A07|nr:rhamnan synthesis F family protein [Methanobrevibacter sp.]MEE0935636.1 rhamnan synthesis F family protein [Methanobrevibacter sp.]
MKRLGIFCCFDGDGIIDDYIYYMLNDIKDNLDELFIVANGFLKQETIYKLSKYSDNDIIFRDNVGFDAWAWREVMFNIGFINLSKFDEIILFNDSFFGPIYPFKEMFDKMDGEEVDFWGITQHGEAPNHKNLCPYGYRPVHLQTYFLAFRKNLVESDEFKSFWINLPNYKNNEELTFKFEAVLTRHFEDLDYTWKAYVDTDDLEESREKVMNLYAYDMHNLVLNRSLPVLKRKAFKIPRKIYLRYNMASDLSNTITYLEENTNYDTSLIYKYLLRTMDPGQLVDNLNLVKIIPKYQNISYSSNKKVLVIVHLYYEDIWEYAFNYLKNVPNYIDVLITTDTCDKKEFFEENIGKNLQNDVTVIKVEPRGRDMAALLVGARDIVKNYDYFCFMHDKKSQGKEYITVGATFRDVLWENNLASPNYINDIIKEFDDNPSLGLLVPPKIYHGTYFNDYITSFWSANLKEAKEVLDQMGIVSKINKSIGPLSIGNCFWAKYDALEPLFALCWDYDDFPKEPMPGNGTVSHALERIYGYVAAGNGYYTKFIMTDEYAESEIFNHSYMFMNIINNIKPVTLQYFVYSKGFFGFVNSIRNGFTKIRKALK